MLGNFRACLTLVLVHEGGYVNHPKDPGGATNKGITQAVYDAWRKIAAMTKRSVRFISDAEVEAIYRAQYWAKVAGDDLPKGLDYATFDSAVNSGVYRGVKWLQKAVGVPADGVAGNVTVAAAQAVNDRVAAIKAMCAARMTFLRGLSIFSTFGKGWTRRVAGVEAKACAMAIEDAAELKRVAEKEAAEAEGAAEQRKKEAVGVTAGGGVAGGSGTQVPDLDWSGLWPWLIVAAAAALIVTAVVLASRSMINRERAAAWRSVAAQT